MGPTLPPTRGASRKMTSPRGATQVVTFLGLLQRSQLLGLADEVADWLARALETQHWRGVECSA